MDGVGLATIKLLVFLPVMIGCIYLIGKLYGKTNNLMSRNMKVLETMQLSKDNSLAIVKIGEDIFLVSSSNGRVELLKELESEKLMIQDSKDQLKNTWITGFLKKGEGNEK